MQKSLFANKAAPQPKMRKRRQPPKPKRQLDESILELMDRRERQVLVHSCLYYYFDNSIIPDAQYDKWSHELFELIQNYPDEFKQSSHYRDFLEFDGNTGMGLPYDSPFAIRVAERLMKK